LFFPPRLCGFANITPIAFAVPDYSFQPTKGKWLLTQEDFATAPVAEVLPNLKLYSNAIHGVRLRDRSDADITRESAVGAASAACALCIEKLYG
jgi:hypothetical protein